MGPARIQTRNSRKLPKNGTLPDPWKFLPFFPPVHVFPLTHLPPWPFPDRTFRDRHSVVLAQNDELSSEPDRAALQKKGHSKNRSLLIEGRDCQPPDSLISSEDQNTKSNNTTLHLSHYARIERRSHLPEKTGSTSPSKTHPFPEDLKGHERLTNSAMIKFCLRWDLSPTIEMWIPRQENGK